MGKWREEEERGEAEKKWLICENGLNASFALVGEKEGVEEEAAKKNQKEKQDNLLCHPWTLLDSAKAHFWQQNGSKKKATLCYQINSHVCCLRGEKNQKLSWHTKVAVMTQTKRGFVQSVSFFFFLSFFPLEGEWWIVQRQGNRGRKEKKEIWQVVVGAELPFIAFIWCQTAIIHLSCKKKKQQ